MRRDLLLFRALSALALSATLAFGCAPAPVEPGEDAGVPDVLPVHRGDDGGPLRDAGPGDGGEPVVDSGPLEPPSRCSPAVEGERFGICAGRLSFEAGAAGSRFGVEGRVEVGAKSTSGSRFGVIGGELYVP